MHYTIRSLTGDETSETLAAHILDRIDWKALHWEVMSLCSAGRYDRAVELARATLDLAELHAGKDHPIVAACLVHLAGLYRTQGDDTGAEQLLERALAIMEKAAGELDE